MTLPDRERILAAVQELDYRPNAFARGLKLARTMTIGAFELARFGAAFFAVVCM